MTATGPLSGIRVLELGNFIAAPFAARLFSLLEGGVRGGSECRGVGLASGV